MKKVGIIGGIGPASTLDYYKGIINGCRAAKQDGYPEIVVNSINMTEMLGFVEQEDWDSLTNMLLIAIRQLKSAGAEFAAIASNTPHIVFDRVKEAAPLPLISIVEATCEYALRKGCTNVLILGTKFTMGNGLYTEKFLQYGLRSFVPNEEGKRIVHNIIFPKLEDGIVVPEDKETMLSLAKKLMKAGHADGLVLGCTELPLMVQDGDLDTEILNTTQIHVQAIVKNMLDE